ncbi:MAG: glycine cleavage system protein GcvH [Proteobacteria bacterium]|nr:glycine cleavage system protein GcvH [Pseudomonadota bacterium]NOG61500.1 glycine cleavage system protein GcvH [Pseudomonadota bacterium]
MNAPADLKYTNTHAWLEDMGDNKYRVGITDYAQDELGDIVYVEPPEVDKQYAQIEECAVVESVKSTSDIYCPLSGVVVEINPALEDSPEIINTEPYSDGWIFILKASDISEMDELIDADEYSALIEEG